MTLDSDYLTPPTKKTLKARMAKSGIVRFFDADHYLLLSIICDLLMDQDSNNRMVEIALFIDERLQNKESDGWRYDCMPPDGEMYTLGLKAIESTSIKIYEKKFTKLNKEEQKELLVSVQKGDVDREIWTTLNAKLFFEEVLAETTEIFFSHPVVQTSINYVGMGDAKGWRKLELNARENLERRNWV